MPYTTPWSNFHELNLDWILEQLKQLRTDVDAITGSSTPYDGFPVMDGTADPGDSINYARGNHVHPTDTSRAAADDLTQEITDRGNADLALAGDIAIVDAKIKLGNTAPLMDGGSATAGSSTFMSREDHVHPTDTSRASKSEFDSLKAVVDGWSGGASPSDTTPQMDGVGAAGSAGNYSRGDHVHPSDTSKLDVAGGSISGNLSVGGDLDITGDATVSGNLVPAKLATYGSTDSVGWKRVATVPNTEGTMVRIQIQKIDNNTSLAESHGIDLVINTTAVFFNESSLSAGMIIDKIRYTDAGKVDIHVDQVYDSNYSVTLIPYGSTQAAREAIEVLATPAAVADAPGGETIVTTFDLHQNSKTDGTITASSYGSTINADSYLTKSNGFVDGYVNAHITAATANSYKNIALIEDGFRLPVGYAYEATAMNMTNGKTLLARAMSDGTISIYPLENLANNTRITFPFHYPEA